MEVELINCIRNYAPVLRRARERTSLVKKIATIRVEHDLITDSYRLSRSH